MPLFRALATEKHKIVYFLLIFGILILVSAAITVLRANAHQKDQSVKIPKKNTSIGANVIFSVNHSSEPLVLLEEKTRLYNGNLAVFETSFLRDRAANLRSQAVNIRRQLLSVNSSEPMTNQSSHQIHLFTYATHAWNMTLERFILGAERSELYDSIHPFLPEDLERIDPEFANEFQEILSLPRGGGYWLWKFPLLEYMLSVTPPQEFIFYLDSGSTLLSSGKEVLDSWLNTLASSSLNTSEILRFHFTGGARFEKSWCVINIFDAFNLSCLDPQPSEICESAQLPATGFMGRNGAALRETLALIYDAISQDPWIITDFYNRRTRKMWRKRHERFSDNRHDQCLLSLASKILGNYVSLDVPDNHNLQVPWNRVFQFSRIKGVNDREPLAQMDLKSYQIWKDMCFPRNISEDMFCDSLSLALRQEDSSSGLFTNILMSWNKSIDS